MTLALIDLDPLPYSYGELTFDDGALMPDSLVQKMVDDKIRNITERSGADDWIGYLSDSPSNFRNDIATILPYKGNRDGNKKPPKYQMLRDYLQEAYPDQVTMIYGMEADDALAIYQYKRMFGWPITSRYTIEEMMEGCNTIICTIDKDLEMVPGWHYKWAKGSTEETPPFFVTEIEGLRFFYKQLMTGDATDNIKGLHGVGKKSKLLDYIDDCEEEWMMAAHVYEHYTKRFGYYAASFMRENATLLWMKRSEDDVFNYDSLLATNAEVRAPVTHDYPPHVDWSQFKPKEEEDDLSF